MLVSVCGINPENMIGRMAVLRVGECYIAKGDLSEAWKTFQTVGDTTGGISKDISWEAGLNMAFIRYYEGKMSDAKQGLDSLLTEIPPSHNLYNDLLSKSMFLEEHMHDDSAAVVSFARGEFFIKQRRISQAAAFFEDVIEKNPETSLRDDCLYRAGELRVELGDPKSGISNLQELKDQFPESYYADRAHKRIGEIYAHILHQPNEAMQAFESFLVNYPHSIFIDDVRNEIRMLEKQ